ncbi:twin-arginine translocation signal domain-containing protein [Parapedobacter koreensis]|uniref:Tat (Twin-arginine translocation) pathway signal sequence n=1 Tax=Parapedobacter koreensis TaxID=332977 RepID=A0A1H7G7R9_9SPHI|nr:twin-arginine translocation signal domain-containing protein [Parapedobacter koreensis]SEK34333.1 Tat (twin-arginine translocation) pathway signal sequence [Parapedobacter koreensis]
MKDNNQSRREFIKHTATLAGMAGMGSLGELSAALAQKQAGNDKIVGIQIGPESFVDEGTEYILDTLQEKGAVNTLFLTTFTYGRGFAGRMTPGRSFPDHGKPLSAEHFFHGGYFAKPHPEFYKDTVLKHTRAPDHGDLDIVAEVLPAARKRGMRVFCGIEDRWDSAFDVPGLEACAEVDLAGNRVFTKGRRITQSMFNPNVRAFWKGLVSDVCTSYDIDGVLFLNERTGPLMTVLTASPFRDEIGDPMQVTCFDAYHEQAAGAQNIDYGRAKEGYLKLAKFVQDALSDRKPTDGYYVYFQRLLLQYPEIVAYDRLFDWGKHQIVDDVRGAIKAVRKELQVVFHVEHTISFNPFIRSGIDYGHLASRTDFLKPVAYNNCGGERYVNFIRNVGSTIFRGVPLDELLHLNNQLMGFSGEASLEDLPKAGLSANYVFAETKRALAGVNGQCGILTGIDIDIPVGPDSRRATPEDTYKATYAALEAGAQGVILSRKYSEMRNTNLAGAGRAVRDALKA